MSPKTAEEDPAEPEGGDAEGDDGQDGDGGNALVPLSKRAQKKLIRKEAKAKLVGWSFLSGYDPRAPIRAVFEGDQIGTTSGDGEAIGLMIVRLSKLFGSLGARLQLESLAFEKSVTVEFRAPEAEAKRAQKNLENVKALREAAGESPSPEQTDEINLAAREALTDIVVAAELASELVSAPSQQAPEVAVAFGSNVAGAYKTLANAVAKARVTVTIEAPDREPTQLSPAKAIRVAEELQASTEPQELEITAFGTLSLANQEQHGFGLRLDPDASRHPLLKGKRVVHGTYLPAVEAEIRDQGLWGREVRATLHVVRDALISTSTVRPATYTLTDVEPRHSGVSSET